jgi:hypothetical protein
VSARSLAGRPADRVRHPKTPRERAPWSALALRAAVAAAALLLLSGCITALVIVAASMRPSPQSEFEALADGRLYAPYLDSCYWRARYDPAHSLCGRLIESREIPEGVEYVHGPYGECVYSLIADSKTGLITSWRYISAPQNCWTQPRSG